MKKILISWILLSLYVTLNADNNATFLYDGSDKSLFVDKDTFYVSVTDEVTGGCLPKPKKLKAAMEKALKNHGFKIVDNRKDPFIPEVSISTLGFKVNGMCAVEMSVDIYFPIQVVVPVAVNVPSGNKTYVTYGYDVGSYIGNFRRHQMQKQLHKIAKKLSDRIYMKVSKSRDEIYAKFPSIEAEVKKKQQNK